MITVLLIIIYLSFISLGLPDSLLGSAWPAIRINLNVPVSYAGILTIIMSVGTITSSLFSGRIIKKFGTGLVTAISTLLTAIALLGFSFSHNFLWFCVFAVPVGFGAGSIDSALNNYVALHYKARHMSWLHCFWGIGASVGPLIMSLRLQESGGWKSGYLIVSIIQFTLVAVLFISLPLWKKAASNNLEKTEKKEKTMRLFNLMKIKGVKPALFSFFCYCALELTVGLWGSTFLVDIKNISPETATKWISLFYIGITFGRAISGFVTFKINSRNMIRAGQILLTIGILILLLPIKNFVILIGLFVIGLGCSPIYPSMLHLTPKNFGADISQSVIGAQIAFANIGATVIPPLFGLIAQYLSANLFPIYISVFLILLIIMTERINKIKSSVNKILNN